jgi:hypothetical protein
MGMTIYEIDQAILACIDEDGEIIDIDAFETLQIEKDIKIDNIACWYKQILAEAAGIKAERGILHEREKQKENQAERLKNFLSQILDGQKFETARNKISWRKSESIGILDEKDIPSVYLRQKIAYEPDKAAIKEAISGGAEVPGAELVSRNNIQIK